MKLNPATVEALRKRALSIYENLGGATLALEGIESRLGSPHIEQQAGALQEADQLELCLNEAAAQLEDLAASARKLNSQLRQAFTIPPS